MANVRTGDIYRPITPAVSRKVIEYRYPSESGSLMLLGSDKSAVHLDVLHLRYDREHGLYAIPCEWSWPPGKNSGRETCQAQTSKHYSDTRDHKGEQYCKGM